MSQRRLTLVIALVAVTPLLVYPLAVLAGGSPSFPRPKPCGVVAEPGETAELDLVYGRFETEAEASDLRDRVVAVGFVGTEVRPDACGGWIAVYDGITDYANGASVVDEARTAGFDPHLEIAPG